MTVFAKQWSCGAGNTMAQLPAKPLSSADSCAKQEAGQLARLRGHQPAKNAPDENTGVNIVIIALNYAGAGYRLDKISGDAAAGFWYVAG